MLRLIHLSLFLHHVVLVSSGSLQLSYSHPIFVNLNLQHISLTLHTQYNAYHTKSCCYYPTLMLAL